MAVELEDALNVGKFFFGVAAFWVERECAVKALARFSVALARSQHQTQVEECFIDAADFAAGRAAMRCLGFSEAAGNGEKCAEKNMVGGVARCSINCAAISPLGNAVGTSLLIKMAEAPVDQLALVTRAQPKCSPQRGETFGVARHRRKRIGEVKPDDAVAAWVISEVAARAFDGAAEHLVGEIVAPDLAEPSFRLIACHVDSASYA